MSDGIQRYTISRDLPDGLDPDSLGNVVKWPDHQAALEKGTGAGPHGGCRRVLLSSMPATPPAEGGTEPVEDCISCGEKVDQVCPKSPRACGHHCNHSWSHERCCWCGKEWGGEQPTPEPVEQDGDTASGFAQALAAGPRAETYEESIGAVDDRLAAAEAVETSEPEVGSGDGLPEYTKLDHGEVLGWLDCHGAESVEIGTKALLEKVSEVCPMCEGDFSGGGVDEPPVRCDNCGTTGRVPRQPHPEHSDHTDGIERLAERLYLDARSPLGPWPPKPAHSGTDYAEAFRDLAREYVALSGPHPEPDHTVLGGGGPVSAGNPKTEAWLEFVGDLGVEATVVFDQETHAPAMLYGGGSDRRDHLRSIEDELPKLEEEATQLINEIPIVSVYTLGVALYALQNPTPENIDRALELIGVSGDVEERIDHDTLRPLPVPEPMDWFDPLRKLADPPHPQEGDQ
jgi:hypothetical protein